MADNTDFVNDVLHVDTTSESQPSDKLESLPGSQNESTSLSAVEPIPVVPAESNNTESSTLGFEQETSQSQVLVTKRSNRHAKTSFIGIESQKNELAFSLYASINREIRNIDKVLKLCTSNEGNIDVFQGCYDELENKAAVITSDYARMCQLSQNKVEKSITQNFELYVNEVESAKASIKDQIDRERDEEEEIKQKEEELEEQKKLLAEEQKKFEEYMANRRHQQQLISERTAAASQGETLQQPTTPTSSTRHASSTVSSPPSLPLQEQTTREVQTNGPQLESASKYLLAQQQIPPMSATLTTTNPSTLTPAHSFTAQQQAPASIYTAVPQAAQPVVTTPANVVPTQQPNTSVDYNSPIQQLAHSITQSMKQTRKTEIEPEIFKGDPLLFADWECDFDSYLESQGIGDDGAEKIRYLKKYVGGIAKECISSQFYVRTDESYRDARTRLKNRFGKQLDVARVMRDKLHNWLKVPNNDADGLLKYADYLDQCKSAKVTISGLSMLDDPHTNEQLAEKLPEWAKRKWATKVYYTQKTEERYPTFGEFTYFVAEEAEMLSLPLLQNGQRIRSSSRREPIERSPQLAQTSNPARPKAKALTTQTQKECLHCLELHSSAHCFKLLAQPFDTRLNFVKSHKLCYTCGEPNHNSQQCVKKQKGNCKKCTRYGHPTILHKRKEDWEPTPRTHSNQASQQSTRQPVAKETKGDTQTSQSPSPNSAKPSQEPRKLSNKNTKSTTSRKLYNMGMPVYVSTAGNPSHKVLVYAFMDSGSDSSYITQDLADKLKPKKLSRGPVDIETMTGETKQQQITRYGDFILNGYYQGTASLPTAYEWKEIPNSTGEFANSMNVEDYPHLGAIADMLPPPLELPVGLLIGANCASATFPLESIHGSENQPYAVKSELGWMVYGVEETIRPKVKACQTSVIDDDTVMMSQDDYKFMGIMENGTTRNEVGSYQMPLPFKERPVLPNNRGQAMKRLINLQRRFSKDKCFKTEYEAFMKEIIDGKLAEQIADPEQVETGEHWYIPHFAVTHPQKKKIRVVFDCKAPYEGTSLNDHLLQGPDMYNSLIGILCRFRKEPIALSCDIQKMFFNFFVNYEDRDYLRFLWPDNEGIINTWRMKVHLFGACSSPAVATYGLRKIADDHTHISEVAARFIKQDFYVDDGITSVATEAEAVSLIAGARAICKEGNLRLHKFCSNSAEVLATLPESERFAQDIDLFKEVLPEHRTLGLLWTTDTDSFKFVNNIKEKPTTRRGLLSIVSQLYDPLGFIAPHSLLGKNILQQVNQSGVSWDEEIPDNIKPAWNNWFRQLPTIETIHVPRCTKPKTFGQVVRKELHHFSDASENGIGACSYIRQINLQGQCHVEFLVGKAKVVPSKGVMTIPRLELLGATAATQLSNMLHKELNMTFEGEYFWTDSEIVLGWLANSSKKFKTYVTNRTRYILEHTKLSQWHHVPGHLNPADIASRGMSCERLLQSMWFTGPEFLHMRSIDLLKETHDYAQMMSHTDPELKTVKTLSTVTSLPPLASRFEKYASWTCLKRAIANLQQMVAGTKANAGHWRKQQLTVEHKQIAEDHIIKEVQELHFSEEIKILRNNKCVTKKSALFKLDPFLDQVGKLRVGGRAKFSLALTYEEKHPVIMPNHHHVSALIAQHFHNKVHHQGRTMTLAKIRNSGYWIIGSTRLVKTMIHQCTTCKRFRGRPIEQKMSDLPQERTEPTPPFTHIGMDCFGHFTVKERRTELKRWGLLLTCFYSRAVHVELLNDMTSDSLINALRNFMCIRGPIKTISCDRGTNFVGANNELLKELSTMDPASPITKYLQNANIEFKFNTPTASHAGGLWERQIKNIRAVLNSLVPQYKGRLDTEGLRTAFYEAMATVNSRPLSVSTLNEPYSTVLTPNHLITMKSENVSAPPGNFDDTELYGRRMWRKSQQFAEQFWYLWKSLYLTEVTKRQRWEKPRRNLKINDIVLILEDDAPRNLWKTAIVEEVKAGADGLVRSARVRLANRFIDKHGKQLFPATVLNRPVQKLILLHANDIA